MKDVIIRAVLFLIVLSLTFTLKSHHLLEGNQYFYIVIALLAWFNGKLVKAVEKVFRKDE